MQIKGATPKHKEEIKMTKSELYEILDKGMHTTMYERGPYIGTPHLLIDFRSPVEVPEFADGGDSTIYADYRWWEENPNCSCPHRYVLWMPKQWDTAEFQGELAKHNLPGVDYNIRW